ncbi:Acetyl esterase [Scedosporium apiospermum]|uniref:Acetyl esterase n=1 Tax=Pseudallescheria apiosperma TaxID=563466 RepID=A0A084FZG0_PSEDA|nr:Acetyl esterase [Scedosporium apiospermum]KEZ40472.1 Acetyl esterase [Scedosporium apiospermum]
MKATLSIAAALVPLATAATCGLKKFENLVTFGDSYTDEGRLGYFIGHNGEAPPAGELLPTSSNTASGGYTWPHFVSEKSGAKSFNYAVSGATCSNSIVERDFPLIGQPFPSVADYEVPAFKADLEFDELYGNRTADNTVYTLWIGTNDLGFGAFLSDNNKPGTTLTSFVDCVFGVFDSVYETGGRNFVLLNIVPLEQLPLYNLPELGGTLDSQFWQNKTAYNVLEYKNKIHQYSTSVNTMLSYGASANLLVENRWPGASFTIFDVHSLLNDLIANPDELFDAPADVTGYYHHCEAQNNSNCVDSEEASSSFLWYDELHPSARTDEIIADEFLQVIAGTSKYATTHISKKSSSKKLRK